MQKKVRNYLRQSSNGQQKRCGATKGGKHLERKTWWWNEEVQESLRRKKDAFKKWQMQGENELKEAYKNMKRDTNDAVAKAKYEAHKEWYDKMGTEEGERMIYKWQNKGQH